MSWSSISWIWRVAADYPNLLFDTAWWMPADLRALFALVPPGQILFASDAPYGNTAMSVAFQLRTALQPTSVTRAAIPADLAIDWVTKDGRAKLQVLPKHDALREGRPWTRDRTF